MNLSNTDHKPRILLTDNRLENRLQIKKILSALPFEILEASSGEESIELCKEYEFSLILLDLHMPNLNGLETTQKILKEDKTKNIPIILISDNDKDRELIYSCYNAGIVDFILWSDIPHILPHKINIYTEYSELKKSFKKASLTNTDFLSNMSHELRTPLNSILVLAQLLKDNSEKNLTDKQLKFAKTIYSSGTDLLHLINEILDLSKIESGNIDLIFEDINIRSFIEDLTRKNIHLAQKKGLNFSLNLDPNLPVLIKTDSHKLNQIMNNLLSNAIKFTAVGQVNLTIKKQESTLESSDSQKPSVVFIIKDTGIGILESKKNIIFDAFKQADTSIQKKYGGTGLGLSISKKLAHMLGGTLVCESTVGKGSSFYLALPESLEQTKYKNSTISISKDKFKLQSHESIPPAARNILKGKKVILSEDDIINIYVMLSLLEKVEITPIVVTNGLELLKTLENNPNVDLILMDIMMPEMDGYTATKAIRSNPKLKHIPIIAVTAKAMKTDKEKGFQAGVDGYVTKPILAYDLMHQMSTVLTKNV